MGRVSVHRWGVPHQVHPPVTTWTPYTRSTPGPGTPPDMATTADGTHPTGMGSSSLNNFLLR